MKNIISIIFAVLAGAVLPVQAVMNFQLGKSVQQPLFAAFVSFVVGALALAFCLIFVRFDVSSIGQARSVSPVLWLSGVLGAFYVSAVIILAPKLGTALTFSLVVAGQMMISIMLDHFGFAGLPVSPINWQRLAGVVLLILGVLLIRR